MPSERLRLLVCCHYRHNPQQPCCSKRGSEQVYDALKHATTELDVTVTQTTCLGYCQQGVNVRLVGGQVWHTVAPQQAVDIVSSLSCTTKTRCHSVDDTLC